MQILSQDGKNLINSDWISQLYIEETGKEEVKIMAVVEEAVSLGSYKKKEHAELAFKFIGASLVDPEKQNKITVVPTDNDMASTDCFSKDDSCGDFDLGSLVGKILGFH